MDLVSHDQDKEIENLKNRKWILLEDSQWSDISTSALKIFQATIAHNFNEISEVSLRILGKDKGTFGYVTIPTELWHNAGAYELLINCLNNAGGFSGYGRAVVEKKTSNSFTIKVTGDMTKPAFAYKLK